MRHWQRLSRNNRIFSLTIAILALAATALASSRLLPAWKATKISEDSAGLGGTLPKPSDVYVQKTDDFPELGNALVMVRLTPEQVAVKAKEGTASFTTLGQFGEILFRDDGQTGDAEAGDGLYTAIAQIDEEDLASRASHDAEVLETASPTVPNFDGRTLEGSRTQRAFNFTGFQAGEMVPLNRPVVNVNPTGGPFEPPPPQPPPLPDFHERVLMIRDHGVVKDVTRTVDPCEPDGTGTPDGVWTFRHLMEEMASSTGIPASYFTEQWLKNWTTTQTINSLTVPSRSAMQDIIDDWRAHSAVWNDPDPNDLNLDVAPVRLLAIVPRLDLRQLVGGNFTDAGEVRFIFGFVAPPGWIKMPRPSGYGRGACAPLPFSVIFEYRIPKSGCPAVRSWARSWVALSNHVPGTAIYNDRLEDLTESFVKAGANPSRPNGSALGQLRTNEIELATPWQLREFQLTTSPVSYLNETTTQDTAADSFNNSATFKSWIRDEVAPAISGPAWDQKIPKVPDLFLGSNFLGAGPEVPTASLYWNVSGPAGLNLTIPGENWARHRASLAACSGCHAQETNTKFVHVDPSTALNLPADVSGFLRGVTVNDPAHGSPTRSFSDLARREQDIQYAAGLQCFRFVPVDVNAVQNHLIKFDRLPAYPYPDGVSPADFPTVAVDELKASHVTEVH
jgi:hypothetical protein